MPAPTGRLDEFLVAHAHAFTRAELVRGWSRRRLENGVMSGVVTRILPGVYCAATHRDDPVVRGEALNLWQPGGAVTGALALHLHAVPLPNPPVADYAVPSGQHHRVPAWVRLRQGALGRVRMSARGVTTVTTERAVIDAWSTAPPSGRREVLHQALWSRICTWQQVRRELARTPRVPARHELQRVLGWFEAGATTPLEVRARYETFADPRFAAFEWQAELRLRGRRVRADMLHRAARLVVELDGHRYHSSRAAQQRDRERSTDLAAAGYLTVRFGWDDLASRPKWCRERLLQVLAARLTRAL
ncbi:endonuclease domain-containing protein [Demequina lignilytica]|uniref:DUF559 domain-containing protein n=1 Tax=Demequina lignilytica TaxID=3051663 RepID=A0AB35MKD0_9MICO|nr:DUF559 domain-containing protein [Demequina sp. SYSU T0a273]MDN4484265.1 DUF559 domain-containing protein [Demequina sp. SYSU T0a273]